MRTTPEQLHQWLTEPEGTRLEFKEAKARYDFDKLLQYCVALANEGGGKIVLGVTDRRPRKIVGTTAFEEPGRTEAGLHQRLSHRIPVEELKLPEGQGMNLMFERAIRQGKPLPDLSGTSAHEVRLCLNGLIGDPAFVRFMERLGEETLRGFSTHDFLVLDHLHREQPLNEVLRSRLPRLAEMGAVEVTGRGRAARYLLSQRLYEAMGAKGVYTRKKGLDRDTNKALLLRHIERNRKVGARMEEFRQVLPALARSEIQVLLRELAAEQAIHKQGVTRAARWYPGAPPPDGSRGQPVANEPG